MNENTERVITKYLATDDIDINNNSDNELFEDMVIV